MDTKLYYKSWDEWDDIAAMAKAEGRDLLSERIILILDDYTEVTGEEMVTIVLSNKDSRWLDEIESEVENV